MPSLPLLWFYERIGYRGLFCRCRNCGESFKILLGVCKVFVSECFVVLLYLVEVSVEIGLFVRLDETACDIGAVIGDTLQIGEYILEDISQPDCTLVVL